MYVSLFAAILVLMVISAFFSCSEAAYFSMDISDRSRLAEGGRLARIAFRLAKNPERLLNSILLGNLSVNLMTFTLASVIAFRLQEEKRPELGGLVAVGILLSVILFCEVLPKNFGVMAPRFFVVSLALPLSVILRLLQPVVPLLQKTNILSRRLLWPRFRSEPHLRVGDLERAVELSGEDAALLKREQRVLQNIVSLSDIRAEELMRPRSLIRTFHPPITFEQIVESLQGILPRSGYCILTEPNSDEIAAVLSFTRLSGRALENWDRRFDPVVYVPWSASAAEVFDRLSRETTDVAAVVNEFGETVGILTVDDMIETIFTREQGRSRRLFDRMELKRLEADRWQVYGLTSLRRLNRQFDVSFQPYSSLTVGGLLHEILQRIPRVGDTCRVGGLEFRVTDISDENDIGVLLTKLRKKPGEPEDNST